MCRGCYLLTALPVPPVLGLAGCALCGFSVGIMWPGTISLSSRACPRGGTVLFAYLALAGDLGGTIGPLSVGFVCGLTYSDLKKGSLVAAAFPVVLVLGLTVLAQRNRRRLSSL